jgi:hypothetical protein
MSTTFPFVRLSAELKMMIILSATNPGRHITVMGGPKGEPLDRYAESGDIEYFRFTHEVAGARRVNKEFNRCTTDCLSTYLSAAPRPFEIRWTIRAQPVVASVFTDPGAGWLAPNRPIPLDLFTLPQSKVSLLIVGALELRASAPVPNNDPWTIHRARLEPIVAAMTATEASNQIIYTPTHLDRGLDGSLARSFPTFLENATRALEAFDIVKVFIHIPDGPAVTPLQELAHALRDFRWLNHHDYTHIQVTYEVKPAHRVAWAGTVRSWE